MKPIEEGREFQFLLNLIKEEVDRKAAGLASLRFPP